MLAYPARRKAPVTRLRVAAEAVGWFPGAGLLQVFAECLVTHVMLAVFDGPVLPSVDAQVAGAGQVRGQAGDAVGDFLVRPGAVRGSGIAADPHDLGGVRQLIASAAVRM